MFLVIITAFHITKCKFLHFLKKLCYIVMKGLVKMRRPLEAIVLEVKTLRKLQINRFVSRN